MLKTLAVALSLLDHFTPARQAWGVRELAKVCGMHHSVVHRMLATLCTRGFLVQNEENQKYMLGLRFLELGSQVGNRLHLSDMVKPALSFLAEKTGENIFLTLRDNEEGICVEYAECPGAAIKCNINMGVRFPLTRASHAKVILAYLSPDEQAAAIAFAQNYFEIYKTCQYGKDRKAEAATMFRQEAQIPSGQEAHVHMDADLVQLLASIREQGFCCTCDEATKDTFGISVPLFTHDKEVVGSICMMGPLFRFDPGAVPERVALLQTQQRTIEQALQLFSCHKGE